MSKETPTIRLDALVVLGGEGSTRPRSTRAFEYWKRHPEIKLVLTGYTSGISKTAPKIAESEAMRKFLREKGVPDECMRSEAQSLDTVANLYFAKPLIEDIGAKEIGIVTESFHLPRGTWTARRILGDAYNIYPISASSEASIATKFQELVLRSILAFDLKDIPSGDYAAFTEYMQHKHPFHAPRYGNTPRPSLYKTALDRVTD